MKTYNMGQFAKEIGVTIQTLRNWDKSDKLKPNHTTPSGHIQIIDCTPKTGDQELVEDLIQIFTAFSPKLQGSRAHKE